MGEILYRKSQGKKKTEKGKEIGERTGREQKLACCRPTGRIFGN